MKISKEVQRAVEICDINRAEWLAVAGVTTVGVGYITVDQVGIIISVDVNPDTMSYKFPLKINDIPILIRYSGVIEAL